MTKTFELASGNYWLTTVVQLREGWLVTHVVSGSAPHSVFVPDLAHANNPEDFCIVPGMRERR